MKMKSKEAKWIDRQTAPVGIVDWKEEPSEVVKQLNHQLRLGHGTKHLRFCLRETSYNVPSLVMVVRVSEHSTNQYTGHPDDETPESILAMASEMLNDFYVKVVHCPVVESDNFIWVLGRA
jgi:hypothetical protein